MALAIVVTSLGGYYVFNFVHDYFLSHNIDIFDELAEHTFEALNDGLENNYQASQALSQVFALFCPTVSHWPNCRWIIKIIKLLTE